MGRDLSSSVGLAVVKQQAKRTECINDIDNSACKVKQAILLQFPDLVSKIGSTKTHVIKSKFHQKFTAKHQKSCRVSINLQPGVTAELDRLQKEGHIEKLSSYSDKYFISLTVITAKKDQSMKISLDSKVLNESIQKNNYQMPNIEILMYSISQHLTNTQNSQQA